MTALVVALGVALLAGSLGVWYYRSRFKDARATADHAIFAARNNAEVAEQIGEQLKTALATLQKVQAEEAEDDEAQAGAVASATDAAAFLAGSVRKDGGGASGSPKARLSASQRAHRARFVAGFGR